MADDTDRLAVLIDADNTSPKVVEGLFLEIAKLGDASVRRIYGDFSDDRLRSWTKVLAPFAIIPQQQFSYTTGKNSADITLVIDAMDLLHSGRFDGFCLVSSDSDFTRLASRIREQGVDVYGFGQRKTPEAFRQACRRFFYIENLMPEDGPAANGEGGEAVAASRGAARLEAPSKAVPIIRKAMEGLTDEDGWVSLGVIGQRLGNIAPDFDSRTYGSSKLSDAIRRSGAFELEMDDANHMRVRLKPVNGKSKTSRKAAEAEEEPAAAAAKTEPKPRAKARSRAKPKAKAEAEAVED
ncbi:MAG: NYN domain-containing protein [Pseudomonadota bacterium]